MITVVAVAFLVAHGLIHVAIWAPPAKVYADPSGKTAGPPFVPSRSWALSAADVADRGARIVAVVLASLAGVVLVVAGIALGGGAAWWAMAAVVGTTVGLVLKALYFDRWLIIGVLLDVGVIASEVAGWPSQLY